MNGRKDYIYLMDQEINSAEKEISYDFSGNDVEMQYCSVVADQPNEVIITDGEFEIDATISSFQDGIASFELSGLPRPIRGLRVGGLKAD